MTLLTIDIKYTGGMLIRVLISCVETAVPVIFGNIWQVIVVQNPLVTQWHTNVLLSIPITLDCNSCQTGVIV